MLTPSWWRFRSGAELWHAERKAARLASGLPSAVDSHGPGNQMALAQ